MTTRIALALLLSVLYLTPVHAADTLHTAKFDLLRLTPAKTAPMACKEDLYGMVAAHAPDGNLCVCHQDRNGKPVWSFASTDQICWADEK